VQRPLLVGEYDFTLDAKNRVAVPARLRSAFGEGIYITRWYENSLAGFAPDKFQEHLDARSGTEWTLSSKGRAERRFITGAAVWQALDGQADISVVASDDDDFGFGHDWASREPVLALGTLARKDRARNPHVGALPAVDHLGNRIVG